jgi:hypothetical protein
MALLDYEVMPRRRFAGGDRELQSLARWVATVTWLALRPGRRRPADPGRAEEWGAGKGNDG